MIKKVKVYQNQNLKKHKRNAVDLLRKTKL